jgi:hypothetical protein
MPSMDRKQPTAVHGLTLATVLRARNIVAFGAGWLEDVQPIRRVLAAARPVVEVGTVRARGFVVFSTGHATGCLGADARKHRRIVVPNAPIPPLLERRLRSDEPRVPCVCGRHGGLSKGLLSARGCAQQSCERPHASSRLGA